VIPKRILHVVSSLTRVSGVMSVIMNIYRNIDHSNVQFDFMYFDDTNDSYQNEILAMGGRIYKIPKPSIKKVASFYTYMSSFFDENRNKYIALQIHEVYLCAILAPIAKRNGIKHVIAHSHNTMFSDKIKSSIRNRILCLPLKRIVDIYFACSIAAGEFLYGKKAIESGKVHVINNAIDCNKYKYNHGIRDRIRSELNLTDQFVVGHVGRFNEQKNHIYLLDVFAEIKKTKNKSKLLLIGTGPLKELISDKVIALGLSEDVIFLGQRNNVNEILQAMDVFVMPSLFEGLPVVGIEAQATGLLCYMSDEITKEVSISNVYFMSLSDSPDKWANAIIKRFIDFHRKDCSKDIKNYGFDIKIEAKKTESFYLSLIN